MYANGNEIGRSEKIRLQWPTFRVSLNHKFTVMVYSSPATLRVDILRCGFIDSLIDTVHVSVPGENARSITSSEKRYGQTYFTDNKGSNEPPKEG